MPRYRPENQQAFEIAYSLLVHEYADSWPWDAKTFHVLYNRVLPEVRSRFPETPEVDIEEFTRRGIARALRKARYHVGRERGLIAAG